MSLADEQFTYGSSDTGLPPTKKVFAHVRCTLVPSTNQGVIVLMDAANQTLRLTAGFSRFITEHKRAFMDRVLDNRTRYVTIVLEDIYQSQNASAVIPHLQCLGLQDIHIIETRSSPVHQ